ncbi:MAG: threonine synthase [Gemmatimonadetes bacterium]|nr:threonine synthase [Gemmatimonadota bacterium]
MPIPFRSTRSPLPTTTLSGAIRQGLAPDGGLYIPAAWPSGAPLAPAEASFAEVARALIAPFAEGDPIEDVLGDLCQASLDFPIPVVPLTGDGTLMVLELFHGPTAAFKDAGARFLAACLTSTARARPLEILVATSGDTGGAVAAAFHRRPGVRVTLLYPQGLVSPTQERQLTCWDDNVVSLAVAGTFDDCQRMVKEAFLDPGLAARHDFTSANSINVGRLLPQAAWYASAARRNAAVHGGRLSFIVPSGNLGNAYGALVARAMGYPIGEIILAHNTNRTVPDYLATGTWAPRPSVPTLASAMDVGNPSNFERFLAMHPEVAGMRHAVRAASVDDDAIRRRITEDHRTYGRTWCPHTAVAADVYARLTEAERREGRWCLVATAHPAKFPEVVEPLIGGTVAVPPSLAALAGRPTRVTTIAPTLAALAAVLDR